MVTCTISVLSLFLTKSRNFCNSLIWDAISVNVYFGCYPYKFMSHLLMSRLKIEKKINFLHITFYLITLT